MPAKDPRNQQKRKGNPAFHRMSNANLKARRAASWQRAQLRKTHNRITQEAQHRANVARGFTGWDVAREARAARRHGAGGPK